MASDLPPPIPRMRLGALELLVGCTAVGGSLALMTSDGSAQDGLLSRLPWHSWLIPGIALFIIVGGSQFVGAFALLTDRPYARNASYTAGLILIGWVILQLMVLGATQPALPLVMLAIGSLILYLTRRLPNPGTGTPTSGTVDRTQGP